MNGKALLIFALIVLQLACTSHSDELPVPQAPEPEVEIPKHRLTTQISRFLNPGWEISRDGNVIVVTRIKPVATFGNIAMPPKEVHWQQMKEDPYLVVYQVRIELGSLLSKAEYTRMVEANELTERKLRGLSLTMSNFQSKTTYDPRNAFEVELYERYRDGLRKLPYVRLPDLYDEANSYYVTTTLSSRLSFVYPREERECRAVLENIFSLADGYSDFTNATTQDEYFERGFDELVKKVFRGIRDHDDHELRKKDNLPELRPTR